jgi:hypothetical protein
MDCILAGKMDNLGRDTLYNEKAVRAKQQTRSPLTEHGMRFRLLKTCGATLALALSAAPALADAIDGDWCHSDGRHFSIRGPEIVTPAGTRMQGDYARHWFTYKPPAPERGAGGSIAMRLVNENTVHLSYGEAAGAPEVWLRCSPSVSALARRPAA